LSDEDVICATTASLLRPTRKLLAVAQRHASLRALFGTNRKEHLA